MANEDKLRQEIRLGEIASKAYDIWVKKYVEDQYVLVFETFKSAEPESYGYLHALVAATKHLEEKIKNDIQTGELAKLQLLTEKGE